MSSYERTLDTYDEYITGAVGYYSLYPMLRIGQAYMNILQKYNPKLYHRIMTIDDARDVYYVTDPHSVEFMEFLEWVRKHWDD